ncbi:hypothetical protein V5799_008072 [Amblyomma americanum]|uniref:Uncharacterized protein n=1 Tax=Amblyomma americanum TaxID=6943 RepID=A0AAQ4FFI1_AMBAM
MAEKKRLEEIEERIKDLEDETDALKKRVQALENRSAEPDERDEKDKHGQPPNEDDDKKEGKNLSQTKMTEHYPLRK